jgi:hypothetical protein
MANERNPSFGLTDAHVDDIVDRLLRGRYEKHRPVEALDVVRAGLIGSQICRDYVVARWGERSRWHRGTGDKNGPLSSAGVTMRTNKLWERCNNHVNAVKAGRVDSDELVWRVVDYRSYNTVCFAAGSCSSARQWAFTLFGWTLREGSKIEDLRMELAGCGGAVAASIANIGQLGHLDRQIKEHEARAQREAESAERLRTLHDTIASAAAHLAG